MRTRRLLSQRKNLPNAIPPILAEVEVDALGPVVELHTGEVVHGIALPVEGRGVGAVRFGVEG